MEYRVLGRTGLKVSAIGIGTWQLSGPLILDGKADGFPDIGEQTVIDLIRACGELGINFIDSAEVYGDGEGERRVGRAIFGQRDKWVICSKFGIRRGQAGERIRDAKPQTIRRSLEGSLKRLRTDYIDVYLYHSSPNSDSIATGRETLHALKQEGKIRYYGISTNDPEVLTQMVNHSAADVVMFTHSLLTHPQKLVDLIRQHRLGGIVRGALESGRLSGRYFHETPRLDDEDIRKHVFRTVDTRKYAVYERLVPPDSQMVALALRYVLDFDTTHTLVLGGKSVEQYREALRVFTIPSLEATQREVMEKLRHIISTTSLRRRIAKQLNRLWGLTSARL